MADIIGYDNIDTIIERINNNRSTLTNISSGIGSATDGLGDSWKGVDASLFTNKMSDDYQFLLGKYIEAMDSYIEVLNEAVARYTEHDDTFYARTISF